MLSMRRIFLPQREDCIVCDEWRRNCRALGTAIGKDGTVYVQISSGHGDLAGEYNNTVVALSSKTLTAKDYFTRRPSKTHPATE